MYTAYFLIKYKYFDFKHDAYVAKTIRTGDRYHPLEDMGLMANLDWQIQQELNEYFSGEEYRAAEDCDIEVFLISEDEYRNACDLFIKIDRN